MMAMVEESAIEMGSTGNVGAVSLNSPTSIIMTDNMPEEEIVETEEERWIVRGRVTLIWTIFESTVLTGCMNDATTACACLACSIPSFFVTSVDSSPRKQWTRSERKAAKVRVLRKLNFPIPSSAQEHSQIVLFREQENERENKQGNRCGVIVGCCYFAAPPGYYGLGRTEYYGTSTSLGSLLSLTWRGN